MSCFAPANLQSRSTIFWLGFPPWNKIWTPKTQKASHNILCPRFTSNNYECTCWFAQVPARFFMFLTCTTKMSADFACLFTRSASTALLLVFPSLQKHRQIKQCDLGQSTCIKSVIICRKKYYLVFFVLLNEYICPMGVEKLPRILH
jgi:hypothetical protein